MRSRFPSKCTKCGAYFDTSSLGMKLGEDYFGFVCDFCRNRGVMYCTDCFKKCDRNCQDMVDEHYDEFHSSIDVS